MENRLEGVQHLLVLGSAVAGPDSGGASLGDVDQSRCGDDGGGRGGCGVLGPTGGGADVCGLGRDLHVNKGVGDVVDAVVRDGGRVRLKRVNVASRGREGDVRRVITLPS
jgi:hypothetical protein